MRQSLQHKRFITLRNDKLSSLSGCYGYEQAGRSNDSIANVSDDIRKRPSCVHI
jgi:hypothetical protein